MVDWYARDMALRIERTHFYAGKLSAVMGESALMDEIKRQFGGFPLDSWSLHNFLADLYSKKVEH